MKIIDKLFETLQYTKKVGSMRLTKEEVNDWLYTIDRINDLDYLAQNFEGHALNEYRIPELFRPFIKPSRVSVGTDRKFRNLLKQGPEFMYTEGEGSLCEPSKFNLIGVNICNLLKKDNKDVPITEVRREVLVNDVVGNIVEDGLMPIEHNGNFMPLHLDMTMYSAYECCVPEEVVINDILHMIFV